MVAGVIGTTGVFVQGTLTAYRCGRGNAWIQSHSLVGYHAKDLLQLWEGAQTRQVVSKVNYQNQRCLSLNCLLSSSWNTGQYPLTCPFVIYRMFILSVSLFGGCLQTKFFWTVRNLTRSLQLHCIYETAFLQTKLFIVWFSRETGPFQPITSLAWEINPHGNEDWHSCKPNRIWEHF